MSDAFKPVYDIADLVLMCGEDWNNRRVLRLLRSKKVPLHRNGHKYQVMLSDLRDTWPQLWNSLVEAKALNTAMVEA